MSTHSIDCFWRLLGGLASSLPKLRITEAEEVRNFPALQFCPVLIENQGFEHIALFSQFFRSEGFTLLHLYRSCWRKNAARKKVWPHPKDIGTFGIAEEALNCGTGRIPGSPWH